MRVVKKYSVSSNTTVQPRLSNIATLDAHFRGVPWPPGAVPGSRQVGNQAAACGDFPRSSPVVGPDGFRLSQPGRRRVGEDHQARANQTGSQSGDQNQVAGAP